MPFRSAPTWGPHDAARYLAALDRGGLGLPDRDYYLETGAARRTRARSYVDHVAKMLRARRRSPRRRGPTRERVMAIETSWPRRR